MHVIFRNNIIRTEEIISYEEKLKRIWFDNTNKLFYNIRDVWENFGLEVQF